MREKIKKYQRRSVRLDNYDYSKSGLYFITICTFKHTCLLGKIENERMLINRYGRIAEKEWLKTRELRDNVSLHEFVIMPNHLHGIIEIRNRHDGSCRGTAGRAQFSKPLPETIPTIIRSYKSAVTKKVREQAYNPDLKIWQRNYYEHIIRNEESYLKISEYIINNPLRWREDKYFI